MNERRPDADEAQNQPRIVAEATSGGEWIEWGGGDCPVAEDTVVEIKLRNGLSNDGSVVGFEWRHGFGAFGYETDDDIIAYRVVPA